MPGATEITFISLTNASMSEYSSELGKVEMKHDRDIFECMCHDIVNVATGEKEGRDVIPNSRNFEYDADSVPHGALRFPYVRVDGIPRGRGYIRSLYQQLAIAVKGDKSTLDDALAGATFVGAAGIFQTLSKSQYDPGKVHHDGSVDTTADFHMTAAKIGGVIFISWNPKFEKVRTVSKSTSYRLSRSLIKYGSFLKRKEMVILAVADADSYDEDGNPVEEKPSIRNRREYWEGDEWRNMHRSLQFYFEMEICGVNVIKFMLADGDQTMSRQELYEIGMKEDAKGKKPGEEIYKNMKLFMTKILVEVEKSLNERQFCEMDFIRESENRKVNGSGRLTITYKGHLDDSVLLNRFKNEFNL